jgi:ribosomal-protein-alanine N-acetyltransferase
MPTPILETPRLILRPLELADAEQVQPLFAQWEIVRLLADALPWPFPPNGAELYYRHVALPAMARNEQWHWTLRRKSDPDHLIGAISLMADTPDHNRGFWIGLPYQRQGYATEATIAVTDFWFDTLGYPTLIVPKAAANLASRRISERTGMTLLRTETHNFVSGPHPADIWLLTAGQWHTHRTANPHPDHPKGSHVTK